MAIHFTKTGYVKLVSHWGHGKGDPVHPRRPCIIECDDGDGHYDAWLYTGRHADAIETLAPLYASGNGLVFKTGFGIERIDTPPWFWVETENGDFVPDTSHPDYPLWTGW